MPRSGHDFLLQMEHKFNRRLFLTFRYKAKSNEIYESILSGSVQPESRLINKTRAQTRMQLDMAVTKDVQLRTRLEYVKLTQTQPPGISRQSRENGFSLYQNFRVRLGKSAIICRLSLFEADSFDARIYQYEYDLPGVLTNRALSGRGSRWFILFRYRPNFPLAFHIKYSETYRDDGISVLKSDKSLAIQFDLGK